MPRLYLFAEGQTELTFADTVLKPHLAARGLYMQGPLMIASARKGKKVYRGGMVSYQAMKNDIVRVLAMEKGHDVFFTTMIDLYAIHTDFPGLADAQALSHLPYERVHALEEAFVADIGDPRFLPFIQLHEFEAYLFSDPEWFRYFYDHHDKQIAALKEIAYAYQTPELIDDGAATAPSKRIIAQFPDYAGAKPVVGPTVAELIGLDIIRGKCPHFDLWLTRLESLAGPPSHGPLQT